MHNGRARSRVGSVVSFLLLFSYHLLHKPYILVVNPGNCNNMLFR
jgi:hypothetical protein